MHKTLAQIGDALVHCGFKGSGKFYHRSAGDHVTLVEFANAEGGEGFTVAYGRHPLLDAHPKVHHRDYRLENCRPRARVEDDQGNTAWAYHLDPEALAELIQRLLAGIARLDA